MKKVFAIMITLAAIGISSSSAPAVDQVPSLSGLTCGQGEIAKFNGTNWLCAADVDTDTDTLGSLVCATGQVPLRDASGAWVCGTIAPDQDTLAGLSCSAGQTVKFNGSAWVCDPPRFEVRTHAGGVQTVFDNDTGLEWEIKVNCGAEDLSNPRCVENQYQWSSTGTAADGALFTDFLVKLNDSTGSVSVEGDTLNPPGCYAGHCDWRVPNVAELLTILLGPNPCEPCIDPIFGPTSTSDIGIYWSSTTATANTHVVARTVNFVLIDTWVPSLHKSFSYFARAVRGGR